MAKSQIRDIAAGLKYLYDYTQLKACVTIPLDGEYRQFRYIDLVVVYDEVDTSY